MREIKRVLALCTLILAVSADIANAAAMANGWGLRGLLVPRNYTYHKTPLHSLKDVADLGVDSGGSQRDRLNELQEILEDESQSPDEQSASDFGENVKVFANPAVLRVTSLPTEDEVQDFQREREQGLGSVDNHFDSLASLVTGTLFSRPLGGDSPKLESVVDAKVEGGVDTGVGGSAGSGTWGGKSASAGKGSAPSEAPSVDGDKVENSSFNLSHLVSGLGLKKLWSKSTKEGSTPEGSTKEGSTEGLTGGNSNQGDNSNGGANPLLPGGAPGDLLKNLPPMTVNANTRNHFHIVNVHHHHPAGEGQAPGAPGEFSTRHCFESGFGGSGSGRRCFCSRDSRCNCTKTHLMLVSVCDTLLNDPDLKEFCAHGAVKEDHPRLNHRFSKSQDKFIWDAFRSVQGGLCRSVNLAFCSRVIELEKSCQCTGCD